MFVAEKNAPTFGDRPDCWSREVYQTKPADAWLVRPGILHRS